MSKVTEEETYTLTTTELKTTHIRQCGTGTKTEIQINGTEQKAQR